MNRSFLLAALLVANQSVVAKELEKSDTAAAWQEASAPEQAAFVIAFGDEHGISKRSDLRLLQNCMRDLAANSSPDAQILTVERLAEACLPLLKG